MEKQYYITKEQLELIEHCKDMFNLNADYIKMLCDSEKSDIEYGFELGQIYSNLKKSFMEMMILEDEIKNQSNDQL